MNNKIQKNILLIGDSFVGKTTLILTYINNKFTINTRRFVKDCFMCEMKLDDSIYLIHFLVISPEPQYLLQRKEFYEIADAIILCYSSISKVSFENLKKIWIPELKKYCKKEIPKILIATQIDLREKLDKDVCLTRISGENLARKYNFDLFFECSSKKNYALKEIVGETLRVCDRGSETLKQENSNNFKNSFIKLFNTIF